MLFRILILSMLSALVCSADPVFTSCLTEKGNYTANEKFETNLERLLNDLSSNTTRNASQPGFYQVSVGDSPNQVHGQALCRGDVDSIVCANCVSNASKYIFETCKSRDAVVWYELCQVRYSFEMFFGMQVYTGKYPDQNVREKEVASNMKKYSLVLMFLMSGVSNETAFNVSLNMFSTGEIEVSKGTVMYGLSQCTRDISRSECGSCLVQATTELGKNCSSRQGGVVVSQSCNVRFQLYRFYNTTPNSHFIYSFPKGDEWKLWKVLAITFISALLLAIVICSCVVFHRQRNTSDLEDKGDRALLKELTSQIAVTITEDGNLVTSEELPFVDLVTIKAATNDFADSEKLGQGGFGTVYKGVFPDGKELAVKRLSRKSWQGLVEFKNEVILIAKLQHRNLVRLVGCGFEGDEKLLLYEYMPNRSLDFFIFDSDRRSSLKWETYYNIIAGIARGLLYLHEESRLKIIHRDLKPSNVLLDHEMVAKISDFGMARIFCESQNTVKTKRVVGTYGYMAPEYAMGGLFSIKSDVFSFGVILLEIISGKKNSGFHQTQQAPTLLAFAWRLWKEGKELEFLDPLLRESSQTQDVLRCVHVGLLCVQEDPADRPTMSDVVVLLQGRESMPLPEPTQPALSVRRVAIDQPMGGPSVNELTISSISPR